LYPPAGRYLMVISSFFCSFSLSSVSLIGLSFPGAFSILFRTFFLMRDELKVPSDLLSQYHLWSRLLFPLPLYPLKGRSCTWPLLSCISFYFPTVSSPLGCKPAWWNFTAAVIRESPPALPFQNFFFYPSRSFNTRADTSLSRENCAAGAFFFPLDVCSLHLDPFLFSDCYFPERSFF